MKTKNKEQEHKERTITDIKYLIEQECAKRNLGQGHGISLDDGDQIFLPKSDPYNFQDSNIVTGVVHDGILNYEGDSSGKISFDDCSLDVLSDVLAGIEIEIENQTVELCEDPFYKK